MQDRVGSTSLTPEQLQALKTYLSGMHEIVGPVSVGLTNEERSRTTKMRTDGDWVVTRITDLAASRGMSLPGISVDGMRKDLGLAQQLGSHEVELAAYHKRIEDTILEARSECWWGTMAYYTALVRMSDTDPALADALKPIIEFFAHGKRKKPEEQPK